MVCNGQCSKFITHLYGFIVKLKFFECLKYESETENEVCMQNTSPAEIEKKK